MPPSNSPVVDVTSTDLRCNVNGLTGVPGKCSVAAGQIVTVEMHAVCFLNPRVKLQVELWLITSV
jgi:hypothetical protein